MPDDLHSLLARQLKRAGADSAAPPDAAAWAHLLAAVGRTYVASEDDRYLLERALDLSSQEMQVLYARTSDERNRLQRELEIAAALQSAVSPATELTAPIEVASRMIPASEAGGDYCDVVAVGDTCWIAIGDVAGHGLRSAVIMLMTQSIVGAMIRMTPTPSPAAVLEAANRVLWDNVRTRLRTNEYVTCTLLECRPGGRVRYAGAHEDLLVCRAATGDCEHVPTAGVWLAAAPEIAGRNRDAELALAPGDLLVLYTDGITEAMSPTRQQFGLARLSDVVRAHRTAAPAAIRDAIIAAVVAWLRVQEDDITVVVARYR